MESLHDFTARLLLRYFRAGRSPELATPRLNAWEDLDFLRYHWAVSSPLLELCRHVHLNRHEMQSSLQERMRTDDAIVRGRLDARATVLARALSGHPSRVVFAEPTRSYTSGPNHVLVWVLQRAHLLLDRLAHESSGTPYTATVADAVNAVAATRRISNVSQAIAESDYTQRPSPQSLHQAAAARKRLYRLAHAAYVRLQRMEEFEPDAIAATLRYTLVAPLNDWQTFELALVLAMGAALSEETGAVLQIKRIGPGATTALIEVGDYCLYWQRQTDAYTRPEHEESEKLLDEILVQYASPIGGDKPDIVVLKRSGDVVALGEVKFFTNETDGWPSALRSAATQLVRYGRGYATDEALRQLLGRSIIGLWNFPFADRPAVINTPAPFAVDFSDLRNAGLSAWAKHVVAF